MQTQAGARLYDEIPLLRALPDGGRAIKARDRKALAGQVWTEIEEQQRDHVVVSLGALSAGTAQQLLTPALTW
jgi:hypothetical protein